MRPGTLATLIVVALALLLFGLFLFRRGDPGTLDPPSPSPSPVAS